MNEDQPTMTSATASAIPSAGVSWQAWLHEHGSKLLLFARQQTRSIADAEDVLQIALIKLAEKEADGTFTGGQKSWLPYVYSSIRRRAIDLGRKEDRRSRREEKAENDRIAQTGGVNDPWFNTESADDERSQYLQQALKQIPEKFSTLVTMKIWGEQTFAEIAKALKISPNTAASRYRYGLEALKKQLAANNKAGDIF